MASITMQKPKRNKTKSKKELTPPKARPKARTQTESLSDLTPAPKDDGRGVPQREISDVLAEPMPEAEAEEHVVVAYIKRLHGAAYATGRKVTLAKWRAGWMLARLKAGPNGGYGKWTAFCDNKIGLDRRTCNNYIAIALSCTEDEAKRMTTTELYQLKGIATFSKRGYGKMIADLKLCRDKAEKINKQIEVVARLFKSALDLDPKQCKDSKMVAVEALSWAHTIGGSLAHTEKLLARVKEGLCSYCQGKWPEVNEWKSVWDAANRRDKWYAAPKHLSS